MDAVATADDGSVTFAAIGPVHGFPRVDVAAG
jgi:hypothetical protein